MKQIKRFWAFARVTVLQYLIKNEVDIGLPLVIYAIGALFAFIMSWGSTGSIVLTSIVTPFSWLTVFYYVICGG